MNCPKCDSHVMGCGCIKQVHTHEPKKNISSGEDAFLEDHEDLSEYAE